MKRFLSSFLILVICLSLILPTPASAATIKISKAKATMEVDSKLTLKLNGTDNKIVWNTDKNSVASVSKNGEVNAKSAGKATITATDNKINYTCIITVVDSNSNNIIVTPIPTTKPTPTPTPTITPASNDTQNDKTVTVYITKTGSKYHRSGCRYLRQSKISIDLQSAKSLYSPCSICNPPE